MRESQSDIVMRLLSSAIERVLMRGSSESLGLPRKRGFGTSLKSIEAITAFADPPLDAYGGATRAALVVPSFSLCLGRPLP
jgi:hypothetical protein